MNTLHKVGGLDIRSDNEMSKKFCLTCTRWSAVLSGQIWQKKLRVTPHIQWEGQNRVFINMVLGSIWICIYGSILAGSVLSRVGDLIWFLIVHDSSTWFHPIPQPFPLSLKIRHNTVQPLVLWKQKRNLVEKMMQGQIFSKRKPSRELATFHFANKSQQKKAEGFQNNKIIIRVSEKILYLINTLIKYSFPSSMQKVQTRLHN